MYNSAKNKKNNIFYLLPVALLMHLKGFSVNCQAKKKYIWTIMNWLLGFILNYLLKGVYVLMDRACACDTVGCTH